MTHFSPIFLAIFSAFFAFFFCFSFVRLGLGIFNWPVGQVPDYPPPLGMAMNERDFYRTTRNFLHLGAHHPCLAPVFGPGRVPVFRAPGIGRSVGKFRGQLHTELIRTAASSSPFGAGRPLHRCWALWPINSREKANAIPPLSVLK
ncbi:hypothetical protein niasHT_039489 [Heterodera trifolii]|uniref:Secreted protein n=1 Tax=Heterodera trifolii TaxID=157864 RepID=A0ABD2IMA7_9BILA